MRDAEGLEYPDVARACREARRSLVALVDEALGGGANHCAVTVRDSSGKVIAQFFADLGKTSAPHETAGGDSAPSFDRAPERAYEIDPG